MEQPALTPDELFEVCRLQREREAKRVNLTAETRCAVSFTCHLRHLTWLNCTCAHRVVSSSTIICFFRDYLWAHPDERDAYATLKRSVARKWRDD